MAVDQQNPTDREGRLDEVLGAYFDAVEKGRAPSREELISRHPSFADALRSFFAEQDEFHSQMEPLRAASPPPSDDTWWNSADAVASPAGLGTHGPIPARQSSSADVDRGGSSLDERDWAPRLQPGMSFGDYTLLERLKDGGMGLIYTARQHRTNRVVALKMIRSGAFATAADVQRFHFETDLLIQFDHPHIVPVYDRGEFQGHHFYSMKLYPGGDLARRLARGTLGPARAARMMISVARAVHYAHQRGILHRDLKPSNILLDDRGEPHVTDFGLAKRFEAEDVAGEDPGREALDDALSGASPGDLAGVSTSRPRPSESQNVESWQEPTGEGADHGHRSDPERTGLAVGTPQFMAPEQVENRRGAVTTSTDVYGLGATLYALLTGRPPFPGSKVRRILEQVREQPPTLPRSLNESIDRDLEAICLKCLEKDPKRRYASAEVLAADLERWLEHRPVEARARGAWSRARLWARRRPSVAALWAAVAVLTWLGVVAVAWQANNALQARHQRARALVDQLRYAAPEAVPVIIDALTPFRREVRPRLIQLQRDGGLPSTQQVRVAAALAADGGDQVAALRRHLFELDPPESAIVIDALRPHRAIIVPDLWRTVADPGVRGREWFRAVCALAALDPDDPRWNDCKLDVATYLVDEPELVVHDWIKALWGIRERLIPSLKLIFTTPERSRERYLAALVLSEFLASNQRELADLVRKADLTQLETLARTMSVGGRTDRSAALLLKNLEAQPPANGTLKDQEDRVDEEANAVLALALMERREILWRHLGAAGDTVLRSRLIHWARLAGLDPSRLVDRLQGERDPSARYALILSLGEFPDHKLARGVGEKLTSELEHLHRDDPDAGVHSAAEWLLRRLGRVEVIKRHDARAATKGPVAGRSWYMNGEGQTFAIITAPGEGLVGSPGDEPHRSPDETLRPARLPVAFAIGTKEVTTEQFQRFRLGQPHNVMVSPEPDCPMTGLNYEDAAAYCLWLSAREGIPEEQWCYKRITAPREALVPLPDHCERTGYRLPTEDEWEYACRAGTSTSRFFGRSERFLEKYAWYFENAGQRTHPVGTLRPNRLGLFDIYGNAAEVCTALNQQTAGDNAVFRGGYYEQHARMVRSALRHEIVPDYPYHFLGFRLVRSLPINELPAR